MDTPRLEAVAHCYFYDRLLCYWLSALSLHPPQNCHLTATVLFCPDDARTADALDWFGERSIPNVTLHPWPLAKPLLCRRAIGRNLAAKASEADAVLFVDVDYLFGAGSLDAIAQRMKHGSFSLYHPRTVLRHKTHTLGDAAIARVTAPGIYPIDPAEFAPVRVSKALGGCQYVRGDVARRGYLDGHKRMQRPAETWQQAKCDVVYRKALKTRGKPIDVPNIYRIRHSDAGRFTDGLRL